MNENAAEDELSQTIIKLIVEKNPASVKQLVALVKERENLPEEKLINLIIRLQNQGKIRFQKPPRPEIRKLGAYMLTEDAYWYWVTIALGFVTAVTTFAIPENDYPLVFVRYVLGTIFVFWLPGYSLIRALFPSKLPSKASEKSLDILERVALSIGMSLALVPIVGLLLNYTPWGIRLAPIVLCLLSLTIVFATAAVVREHQSGMEASK